MKYQQQLEQVRQYVISLFEHSRDENLVYHNLKHTRRVVKQALEIAAHYEIEGQDLFIIETSAWFHDVGYLKDTLNHEKSSAEFAGEYLESLTIEGELIESIKKAILATSLPQTPVNLNEQILCDADLYHFGAADFEEINKLVRKEYQSIYRIKMSKEEWLERTIKLLSAHQFHTDYSKAYLETNKEDNMQNLRKKGKVGSLVQETELSILDKTTDKNADKPGRGIETMFRISSSNHQRLSDMADNKANIIITVNSIILSAVLSLLLRRIESDEYLAYPTYGILLVSLLAIIFSILSTRPSIPQGTFSQADMDSKRVNLLFFGNFYKMNFEEYSSGMHTAMADKEFLYGMLVRDVYSQGVVLGKKYRLLRISYNIFMFGLIAAVLSFVIASYLYAK